MKRFRYSQKSEQRVATDLLAILDVEIEDTREELEEEQVNDGEMKKSLTNGPWFRRETLIGRSEMQ